MTPSKIESVIGQYLAGMTDCPPIAWPNKDFTPSGTYLEFRHAPNGNLDETINGGHSYQIGIVLVTVVIPKNTFTKDATDLAQDIIERFPKALRIRAGSSYVVINAPANPGNGFLQGVEWRQPVSISYITED